jgi:hypothetical protein
MTLPSNVRLVKESQPEILKALDYKRLKKIWYLPTGSTDPAVSNSVVWLQRFIDKFSVPIEVFPHHRYLNVQSKAPQSDLVDLGMKVSDIIQKERLDVGGIIAFGPERYDAIFAVAERLLLPVIYIYPQELDPEGIQKEIVDLPIYPYFTPFTTVYFTDVLSALSDALPKLLEEEEIDE